MPILSSTDKSDFRTAMDQIHESMKKPIEVIKKVKKTIVSPGAGSNPLYNRSSGTVTEEEQSFTVYVRTKFFGNLGDDEYVVDIQNEFPDAIMRIKVAAADKPTLDNCESIIFHGQRYELSGQPLPIDTFGFADYYIYYLKLVV